LCTKCLNWVHNKCGAEGLCIRQACTAGGLVTSEANDDVDISKEILIEELDNYFT